MCHGLLRWLERENPVTFFQCWSRPVHIWLKRTVYAPLRPRLGPAGAGAAAFAVSSALHEVTLLVAFRSAWPLSSANLLLAAVLLPMWDTLFSSAEVAMFALMQIGTIQFAVLTWRWWLSAFA